MRIEKMKILKIKKGFTLIELIMVIVVLGILAATAIPKMNKNYKQELLDNVITDIRTAQHLATSDFKHQNTIAANDWQKSFWSVSFNTCTDDGVFTSVGSDANTNGVLEEEETVVDTLTNGYMHHDIELPCSQGKANGSNSSKRIFLSREFNVDSVAFSDSCANGDAIGFDHYGRPHFGFETVENAENEALMRTKCTITFTFNTGDTSAISIAPHTGNISVL